MEAKKMHLCNIPKERPSVDREMNRCLCWIWGACALYEHGFIWIFSLEMDQHLHLVRLEFLLAVVHDGKCASRSAPWRRFSRTTMAGISMRTPFSRRWTHHRISRKPLTQHTDTGMQSLSTSFTRCRSDIEAILSTTKLLAFCFGILCLQLPT